MMMRRSRWKAVSEMWKGSNIISKMLNEAKFKYIKSTENRVPDLQFEKTIQTRMETSGGQMAEDWGILDVMHGDIASLRRFNRSVEPGYLSVFDLSPLLRVHNVLQKKYGDFKDVQLFGQGGARSIADVQPLNIKMTVPEEVDTLGECDGIKIFVTSRPVSLALLELAAIISNGGQSESTLRGSRDSLMKALEILSPPARGYGRGRL